jgi:hypothetical protein
MWLAVAATTGLAALLLSGPVRVVLIVCTIAALVPAAFIGAIMALLSLGPWNITSDRDARAMRVVQRRVRRIAAAVLLGLAVAGGGWYLLAPSDVSTQFGLVATIPFLVVMVVWIGRRVPPRQRLPLAIVIAPLGALGYLVFGGDGWWGYGQMTALPLLILIVIRGARSGSGVGPRGFRADSFTGPWGPP